jgi:phospholipid transport system substrate-binding protein
LIASFILGRYWQTASATERQNFNLVVHDFILRVCSEHFIENPGGSFRIIGQRAESAIRTVVFTEIGQQAGSGRPVVVGWHIIDSMGYRIIDLSVGGLSMAITKRDEFASYLQRNGGDVSSLIQQLQVRLDAR